MAGYPWTSQVEDAPTRKSLISAFDQLTKTKSDLTALIARVDTLETPAPAAPSTTTIISGGGAAGSGPAFGTFGPGDLIAVDSASTLIGLPDVIAGNVLLSGGINTLPSWGKLQLATHVIGTLAPNHGGTGLTTYAVGDLLYASGAAALSRLADVAAGSYLRSGGVGVAPVWSTPTLPNAATTGDLLYASAANVYSNLADVATGNALISGGVGAAPAWGKIGLTTHVSGDLPFSSFVQASAASKLVGRGSASGAGDFEEITLGTGLTMTGTTLSSSGSGTPGGSDTQVQFNDSSAFGGDAGLTYNKTTDTLTIAGLLDLSGAAAGQIKFPASQNASSNANTLDDYEEGTWTPALGADNGSNASTYTTQVGHYVKIGKKVHITWQIVLSDRGVALEAAGGANLWVTGLPFNIETNATTRFCAPMSQWVTVTSWCSMWIIPDSDQNATKAYISGVKTAASTTATFMVVADIADTASFRGSGDYYAA